MSVAVGYGLPYWLDTEKYLSADETRALGEVVVGQSWRCSRPGCTEWRKIERAHVVRKGAGGKKKGTTGPTVCMCDPHHDEIDEHRASLTMAVERGTLRVVLLEYDGTDVVEIDELGVIEHES